MDDMFKFDHSVMGKYIVQPNELNKFGNGIGNDKGVVQIGKVHINLRKLKKDFNKIANKVESGGVISKMKGGFQQNFKAIHTQATTKGQHNPLTIAPFTTVKYDDDISVLKAYAGYLQAVFRGGSETWCKCGLYTWLLRQYVLNAPTQYTLTSNSANAFMTTIDATYYGKIQGESGFQPLSKKMKLLLKVQKPGADDILIDAVNAKIINEIIAMLSSGAKVKPVQSRLRNNFMEYVSSFQMHFDPSNLQVDFSKGMENLQNALDASTSLKPYKCFLAKSIKHATMKRAIKSLRDIEDMNEFIEGGMFEKLIQSMYFFGLQYGFVHNDCHLGNILLDADKEEFVMIDFGRVYFYITSGDQILGISDEKPNLFYQQEIYKLEDVEPTDETYSSFLNGLVDYQVEKGKNTYINPYIIDYNNEALSEEALSYFIRNMVLFDISTMVMNILQTLAMNNRFGSIIDRTTNPVADEFRGMLGLMNVDMEFTFVKGTQYTDVILVIPTPLSIISLFDEPHSFQQYYGELNASKATMVLGVFIFSLFIDYLYLSGHVQKEHIEESESTMSDPDGKSHLDYNYKIYSIKFSEFVDSTKNMYHYYQYCKIPDTNEFIKYFYGYADFIENLMLIIYPTDLMQGGVACQRSKRRKRDREATVGNESDALTNRKDMEMMQPGASESEGEPSDEFNTCPGKPTRIKQIISKTIEPVEPIEKYKNRGEWPENYNIQVSPLEDGPFKLRPTKPKCESVRLAEIKPKNFTPRSLSIPTRSEVINNKLDIEKIKSLRTSLIK
jgi:hypothetical protein